MLGAFCLHCSILPCAQGLLLPCPISHPRVQYSSRVPLQDRHPSTLNLSGRRARDQPIRHSFIRSFDHSLHMLVLG
ncbi:hypothetical protein F4778DRAFT_200076 [Xylariomycetidae sp. FL2044]|nr:hypothetical protein F4778DRAFT_200076 [Xylariomycetidae sp. FL2044]